MLDGRDHVGIDHGSLGRSANGKAPIFDAAGHVIGQVSVGIVEARVADAVRAQITVDRALLGDRAGRRRAGGAW